MSCDNSSINYEITDLFASFLIMMLFFCCTQKEFFTLRDKVFTRKCQQKPFDDGHLLDAYFA